MARITKSYFSIFIGIMSVLLCFVYMHDIENSVQTDSQKNSSTLATRKESSSVKGEKGKNINSTNDNSRTAESYKAILISLFNLPDTSSKLSELDAAMNELRLDPNTSRQDKLRILWELLSATNNLQAVYVLDNLALLQPIELTSELINLYKNSNEEELKGHLLTTLKDNLLIDVNNPIGENELKNISIQSERTFLFFNELVTSKKVEESRFALLNITPLLSESDQYEILSNANNSLMVQGNESKDFPISKQELGEIWLESLIANPNSPELFEGYKNLYINSREIRTDGEFSNKTLAILDEIKEKQESQNIVKEIFNLITPNINDPESYSTWVNIKLYIENKEIKESPLIDYFKSDTLQGKASLINYNSEAILPGLSQPEIQDLINRFSNDLQQNKNITQKQILTEVLIILQNHNL